GGALLFGSLSLLLLGLNHLHEGPETFAAGAPYHLSMHLSAAFLMALFVWRQLKAPRPLIRLQLFRIPALTCGIIANGIAHSSMLATNLLMPFLLERGRGFGPGQTAELITVMQVFMLASAYLA